MEIVPQIITSRNSAMGTIDTIWDSQNDSPESAKGLRIAVSGGSVASFSRVLQLIDIWFKRRQSRIALSRLSERDLRDIGISRSQAEFEASRPFWDGSAKFR